MFRLNLTFWLFLSDSLLLLNIFFNPFFFLKEINKQSSVFSSLPLLQPSLCFSKTPCSSLKGRPGRALVFAARPPSREPVWFGDSGTKFWHPAASITSSKKAPAWSWSSISCRRRTRESTRVTQAARGHRLSSLYGVGVVHLKTVLLIHHPESLSLPACVWSSRHINMTCIFFLYPVESSSLNPPKALAASSLHPVFCVLKALDVSLTLSSPL